MSGHNKWSQIKRAKEVTDGAKSKVFGKFARLIALETKKAGGNPNSPGVRAVVDRAKAENMPKENIERAIAKGSGADAASLESIVYETYGPGGVAILIDTLTDNRNRTAQEMKHLLSKNGCELAAPGSAAWAFSKNPDGSYTPTSTIGVSDTDGDALMEILSQIDDNDDVQEVYTNISE